MRFVPPPGWPPAPPGWVPPPGWQPDPAWPPAPVGWRFWQETPAARRRVGRPGPALVSAFVAGGVLLVLALGFGVLLLSAPPQVRAPAPGPTSTAAPQTTTVAGWVRLDDRATATHDCEGQGRHADIAEGTAVVVSDQTGTELGDGTLTPYGSQGSVCSYTFSISGVPVDADTYTFAVGDRSPVVISAAELRSQAWSFEIRL
ncbi:hypothetical protein [Microlunatus antarcticus]|uniref:Uncharacterized protein n=1 Tax=Microlunatus antarcticus TaxID=53388 RepID=A0A7W5P6H5_9ACTN|nr:hypothetical protein [Microlunatus antarcticus]MBB3326510.1 hypothetical protein [Microlunatus antarcticus]